MINRLSNKLIAIN